MQIKQVLLALVLHHEDREQQWYLKATGAGKQKRDLSAIFVLLSAQSFPPLIPALG